MTKFRCSSCGEIFEGRLEVCPRCGKKMIYKEEPEATPAPIEPEPVLDPAPVEMEPLPVEEPVEGKGKKGKKKDKKGNKLQPGESGFDGSKLGLLGMILLTGILATIGVATLGFLSCWVACLFAKYIAKHTVVKGRRLDFNGKAIQLWGNCWKWLLLTIVTLSLYAIFGLPQAICKWVAKHLEFKED